MLDHLANKQREPVRPAHRGDGMGGGGGGGGDREKKREGPGGAVCQVWSHPGADAETHGAACSR